MTPRKPLKDRAGRKPDAGHHPWTTRIALAVACLVVFLQFVGVSTRQTAGTVALVVFGILGLLMWLGASSSDE